MNRNSKLLVRFLVIVNIVTIILYMFPPIVRVNHNAPLVVLYLSVSAFMIYMGLNKGIKKGSRVNLTTKQIFRPSNKFSNFIFIFYTFTFLLRYAYLLGFAPLEISGMVGRLLIGIADPQFGYQLTQDRAVSPVPWSIYFLISIIDQIVFIYLVVEWKSFSSFKKIAGVLFIVLELFYWMGSGTNFGVITMLTNIIFALLLSPLKQRKSKSYGMVILIGVLGFVAVAFFSYNMLFRTGGGDSDVALNDLMNRVAFNEDSFILQLLPESLWSSYYYIYSYMCQGYEALGCAMDLPVTWTFFCGNNPALMFFMRFLTGYDFFANSYMTSLETVFHIDSLVAWHSAYLWWANDFTILGALIIVYLLSYLCGYSFMLGIQSGDVISRIVYIVLASMILFLFANNTYLSNVFYSFMFLFPYWLFTRYKKSQKTI